MSLCDFSFDSHKLKVSVDIKDTFIPSKDMRLPWKFDLEHLFWGKRTFTPDLKIFSGGEFPQILVSFSSD